MHTTQAIITGAVQGLSEFLPISSSAHILFSNELYEIITGIKNASGSLQEEIFFSIIVHLATLLAVIIYFFKDLKELCIGFINSIKQKDFKSYSFRIINYIFLATIITGIIGLIFKEQIEKLVINPQITCVLLFITGLILLLSEKVYKGNKEINFKSAILVALAQGLAAFPGFSRSGLTIATALFCGTDRVNAARFSFLMSIPIIFLASFIYPLYELDFNLKSLFACLLVFFLFFCFALCKVVVSVFS